MFCLDMQNTSLYAYAYASRKPYNFRETKQNQGCIRRLHIRRHGIIMQNTTTTMPNLVLNLCTSPFPAPSLTISQGILSYIPRIHVRDSKNVYIFLRLEGGTRCVGEGACVVQF